MKVNIVILAFIGVISATQLRNKLKNTESETSSALETYPPDDILLQIDTQQESQQKQSHRRNKLRNFVQVNDHNKDTDDLLEDYDRVEEEQENKVQDENKVDEEEQNKVEDESFVHIDYNHENDTDDIPDGLDPVELNRQYQDAPPAYDDYNLVQMHNHDNDEDDMLDEHDEIESEDYLAQKRAVRLQQLSQAHKGNDEDDDADSDDEEPQHNKVKGASAMAEVSKNSYDDKDYDEIQDDYDELQSGKKAKISKLSSEDEEAQLNKVQEAAAMAELGKKRYNEADFAEIQTDFDNLQSGKKSKDTQLLQIPHETDTDDVAVEQTDDLMYNRQHSKMWNEAVNRRAEQLEQEIKIQENLQLSQIKAKEQAKRRAERERIARIRAAEQESMFGRKNNGHHATVDLAELYSGMVPETQNLQVSDDMYSHHSKYFNSVIAPNQEKLFQEMVSLEQMEEQQQEEATRDILKPINVDYGDAPADEQDLQYENHSKYYRNVLMPNTEKLAQEMSAEEDLAAANEEEANRDILKPINVDYGDAPADEQDLQTGYEHHSQYYRDVIVPTMQAQADELAQREEIVAQLEAEEHRDLLKPLDVDYGDQEMKLSDDEDEDQSPEDVVNLQTKYERHSKYVRDFVDPVREQQYEELQWQEAQDRKLRQSQNEQKEIRRKTTNLAKEYDGILAQTGDDDQYYHHSLFFEQQVEKAEKQFADEFAENEKKLSELEKKEAIEANGMTPIVPVSDAMAFEYPANDFHHLYESLMVQLNDHSNDYDDIVPEFNEPVSALSERKQEDNHKVDFQGEKYEEYYDE